MRPIVIALSVILLGPVMGLAAGRPNVVVFLVDDLGYGDVGCHGNGVVKTPHVDEFAKGAVEFTRFYVSPVCAPTRASLMTGRWNFRTGVSDVFRQAAWMHPEEVTVAEAMRAGGYRTGLFGKWHLGDDEKRNPNAQGFEEALTFPGLGLGPKQYFDPVLTHNGKKEPQKGYCMDIFTEAAIRFMRENREKPFFVYLAANLIHVPLVVSSELAAEYDGLGLGESTQKIYGMIRSVDNNFGRVLAAMKEMGLEENTLIIFTSDNGPCSSSKPMDRNMAGLHGLKGTVYENGIRVPCWARWPGGFKGGGKVERPAAHIDVMPTVLDACGVGVPAGVKLDGRSLMPLLRDAKVPWEERMMFFQWDSAAVPRRGHAFAVVGERWKLVQPCGMDLPQQKHIRDSYAELCRLQGRGERSIEGAARYELYDVAADPGERKDVAGEHADVVEKMKREYDAWFTEVSGGK